jgi:molecular chaperone GrpE (heat shock protein)
MIQDFERALAEQKEASERSISEIISRLKNLFEEYEKSLNEFGVRPAPLEDHVWFEDRWMVASLCDE